VTTLDARGLLCPLPLTMAKRRMRALRDGETLLVLATDPEATIDLAAWAAADGHAYAESAAADWSEHRLVKRAAAAPGG
jgi:tRNA 2-thiouridine synthesizing protein A